MSVWRVFKVSRKTFFNPSAWLDTETLSTYTRNTWAIIRDIFTTPTPTREESFAEAMERYGVTPEELPLIEHRYYFYAIGMAVFGVLTTLFSFYLAFWHRTGDGFLLGLVCAGLFFAQAFRFHFWHFQIKNRKLGCTFEEWRSGKISKDTTS